VAGCCSTAPSGEGGYPTDPDPVDILDGAGRVHRDVDPSIIQGVPSARSVLGVQRRLCVKGGLGSGKQHTGPAALAPGQRAGVVRIDTRVNPSQTSSTQQSADVVRVRPVLQELASSNDALLRLQQVRQRTLIHEARIARFAWRDTA
jgi:hypothetical protein